MATLVVIGDKILAECQTRKTALSYLKKRYGEENVSYGKNGRGTITRDSIVLHFRFRRVIN